MSKVILVTWTNPGASSTARRQAQCHSQRPTHPIWYHNLVADPRVELQDGPARHDMLVREVTGDEKAQWWARAVEAFPDYADYQKNTVREIPVFVLEPAIEPH
jgi:deazaflavin-dependent oxidoreductase (nitroreductase family)